MRRRIDGDEALGASKSAAAEAKPEPEGAERWNGTAPALVAQELKAHPVAAGSGTTITVTLGREVFSPVQYSTIEVGPISLTTPLAHGETPEQAYTRARSALTVIYETEFQVKLNEYLGRQKRTRATTKG